MLPEALVEELDTVVEKRRRSAFVEAAIREKLARQRQASALRRTAGALHGSKGVAWAEDPTAWVRSVREADDAVRAAWPARLAR